MITVAHVDHTAEAGGAELALARLVEKDPGWMPLLMIPPTSSESDTFAVVPQKYVSRLGVWQPAGAIGGGLTGQLALFARAFYQALVIRLNRSFRRAEVVHANTSRAAIIGWLATVGSRRRLVVHLRDAVDVEALGSRNTKLLSLILGRAAGVIANSNYTLRSAQPHLRPGTPAMVIPSPVGLSDERPVGGVRDDVRVVGMLARITEWKGQELLIGAFADAFAGSTVTLELAGSPAFGQDAYLEHLRTVVRDLGIEQQVRFLGHVSDIWPLLDSWDICVHASLHSEPLGQNVLQYLAACRPVIAANAGGPTEWVKQGHTGLLFETGSRAALGSALETLRDDAELRRALSANLARERPVPTDEAVREIYREFFESVRLR
ncbi:glycosyl transferase [Mycobacterium sp. shizuoka-1]|nr:glycosyl transferase [Mycobacterium sp. shizuoka-1]